MTPFAEAPDAPVGYARHTSDACERQPITGGWSAAQVTNHGAPDDWIPARVPGTVAGALADAGRWDPRERRDFDGEEWWFRTSFEADPSEPDEEVVLCLDGVATVAEVHLNGEPICSTSSMFEHHRADVGALLRGQNELVIRCMALAPLLEVQRRPRARWRTRVAASGLRFFRTMILGRAPGFAPGPAVLGPWRPVYLERRRVLAVDALALRPRIESGTGVLGVRARLRPLRGTSVQSVSAELRGPSGTHRVELAITDSVGEGTVGATGEITVPEVARWWPHTHGAPVLHDVQLQIDCGEGAVRVAAGRVGFRDLRFGASPSHEIERDGPDIHINDIRVFARGALWTPADPVAMAPTREVLRAILELVRDAGMNMLRIPGTGAYETPEFHDLCDELGILVWQDFMFANFDYPIGDEAFRAGVEREAAALLEAVGGRASLTVLCGNSEVEQQAAMLGLDPALGRGELFGELLPDLVRASGVDACYVPSAPCGGELPFRPNAGVANYFGVGGYLRPLEDARRAGVLFASECLAFSNVPDEAAVERVAGDPVALDGSAWSAGIPRDAGADWDFQDVRDHYLRLLFGVDPAALRDADPERYLELSRAVTGEVMAEAFGEWRRDRSPCQGALVLWLADLVPGAGWGVLDDLGRPKPVYHHLRRALSPVALWTTDEGLAGVAIHVANDAREELDAELRVSLISGGQLQVGEASANVRLPGHSQAEWDVEGLLGRFVDASWAYRFGPPAQDAILVRLTDRADPAPRLISQTVRFPAGFPLEREEPEHLGLSARATTARNGDLDLTLGCERLAYGVRIHAPGFTPEDDCLTLQPGVERVLRLCRLHTREDAKQPWLTALNMAGSVPVVLPGSK